MTSLPIQADQDHTSDLFGVKEYAPESPKKKDFLPWHKPRKQFVRQAQWCEQINRMIDEIMPDNNVLKYLGLPGDDLLDLRDFHRTICEPKNLHLRFLGFNHGAGSSTSGAELNISLDEVNKLRMVDPSSDIIGDNICQIANVDSVAWSRSVKMGPYDVINIDLCDGFGKHPHDEFQETHYNTLMQLMTLQARRANPWLLLLTTRTGEQHINKGIFELLKDLYGKNLIDCPAFLEVSNTKFSITDSSSIETATSTHKGMSDVFLTSLCKWIASIALGQNPPSRVEVKSVIGYNVDPAIGEQDLISLAIRIEPTLITTGDRLGLANQNVAIPNECNMAVQALDRVSRMVNADSVLDSNEELKSRMITMTAELLEEARYDVSSYSDWANAI